MVDRNLTVPEVNVDRHYMALMSGQATKLRIKVACGSGEEVTVSQISGGFITPPTEEGDIDPVKSGPLYIDCSKHGKYIGFLQILHKGPEDAEGSTPVAMPLLLIPLNNVEYVNPYGMK